LARVAAHHGLPETVRARLLDAVPEVSATDPAAALGEALHRLYRFAPLPGAAHCCFRARPPLAGVVRHDRRVPDAIRHHAPFLVRSPASPAARDLEALADQLAAAG
jgi:flagellar biosynthesis protein FlhG